MHGQQNLKGNMFLIRTHRTVLFITFGKQS